MKYNGILIGGLSICQLQVFEKYHKIFSVFKGVAWCVAGLGGALYLYWHPDALHRGLCGLGFKVEEVFVEGRKRTVVQDIQRFLQDVRDRSVFRLNLQDVLKRVEDLPWVRSAVVQRFLPNVLYIRICEREPVAMWTSAENKHYIIDKDGTSILPVANFNHPEWRTLLRIVGEQAPLHVLELHKALNLVQKLQNEISYAAFLRSGRWNLYFKQGLCLKLPEGEVIFGLQRFLGLRARIPKNVKVVDLRARDSVLMEFEKDIAAPVSSSHTAKEKR